VSERKGEKKEDEYDHDTSDEEVGQVNFLKVSVFLFRFVLVLMSSHVLSGSLIFSG